MYEKLKVPAALVGSGVAGAMLALQARINGGLSQEIGDGFVAAVVSFGVGLAVLAIALAFSPRAKRGARMLAAEVRSGRFPLWALFGGVSGAFFVAAQGLVATVTGVALFTVGVVAGQVLGGLVMDRVGLGPGGRVDPSPLRIAGTVLAIAAVGISVWGGFGEGSAWLVLVPVVAGALVAWQSAANGLVRSAAQSVITATFLSFLLGTVLLVIAAGASVAVQGWPEQWPANPLYYVGGLNGVFIVAIAASLVRVAGVLLLSMSNVAGQLIASVALEAGLPLAGGVTGAMLVGTVVALVAVVVAALPGRRATAR